MKRVCLLLVLLLTFAVHSFAQTTHTLTGKVTDERGQGYPGAGVSVKGTQLGTVTDVNGDFMLDVPDGSNTIVIQAVGYNTREVKEDGQSLNVKIQPSARELEGAVVTALAIKREKRELGYSSTTLNNEELTAGNNTSALSDLQGKVAGANITSTTGGPGGSTRVILRGEKSFLKNNNALIIIDGVITNNYDRTSDPSGLAQVDFGNSANDIDPDEIESITVLEGPAASALYGAQGTNGAVMITTKHGKRSTGNGKSKMEVTYKATYTQSDVLKYPEFQSKFGQGAIYSGQLDDRGDNFDWGPAFDGQLKPWGQVIDGKQQVKPYSYQPDNLKQFFQHGKDLNNFVSLSGGTDLSTYYLSITSLNSDGVTPNTFYNKYSIRFNGTTQLSNNFYSSVNINYINSYSRAEATGQNTGGIMQQLIQVPTDVPISSLSDLNNPFNSMSYLHNGVQSYGYYGAFSLNPYWAAKYYDNRNKTDRILGDVNIGYKKGDFNVYDRVGIDVTDDRSYYETPAINAQAVDQSIYYPDYPHVNSGGFQVNDYTAFHFYNDLIATYTHQLNHNFGMNATVGDNVTIKQSETLNDNINPANNGLVIPGFYSFTNNTGPITVTDPISKYRTYAVYADVKFNFQRELYLDLTGRNEWSSTLLTGQNSYFYPGANASWVFTERLNDTKFKDKVLNYGKIRIGTAGVSNDAVPYANNPAGFSQNAISTAFGSVNPPFNGVPVYEVNNTFGGQLKPEQTREFEVGTDLSFFKDRISVSFTYYNELTHNLITEAPLPYSTGYIFNYINVGAISNKGEEISLRGTPISTKWGLKWDLFGTYTHNVSDVVSLENNQSIVDLSNISGIGVVAAVGHPYGTFYTTGITYENGHAVVDPTTGLPIPQKTPQLQGSFQPKFQASWGTDLTYKGIKLHALFVTKQGGQYYSNTKELMDFVGASQETTENNRNPLVWAGSVNQVGTTGNYVTNTTKYLPYNYWSTLVGEGQLQTQNLVDASYIKLQEIALSYQIPKKYYQHSMFGSLEAGLFGNNLIIWTPKSNKYDDPEEESLGATGNAQGINFNARPSLRNYGAFLKVTF